MTHDWNPWAVEEWSATEAEQTAYALPLVTLGVLNYNRCDELRQTLDVLTNAVQYPRYEIIVVDNGSSDGSVEMVRTEYPSVQLHEIGRNAGVSSRNMQTKLAKGKYLFSFDDDTCPGTPAMVLRIVRYMESHPEIAALSGTYYQPKTGLNEIAGWDFGGVRNEASEGIEGIFIVEGGVCFRLDALRDVDGYEPRFLYGSEGMELGIQLYKKGYRMCLAPQYLTLHFISPSVRPKGLRAYGNSKYMVWMIAKHWPLLATLSLTALLVARRAIVMAMHRSTARENLRGLMDGLSGMGDFLRYSPKLSWRQVFDLKRFYLFFYRWG